jgi:[protein-PII] uridylyltransferase
MTTAAKQRSREELEQLKTRFLEDGRPAPVLAARTAAVDTIVTAAWAASLGACAESSLALLAVGGYGRRQLFPHSDIDLLLLARRPIDKPDAKAALGEFLRLLWDSGLRAAHSVRTVEECCAVIEGNLELTVSLLDQRLLAGDRLLYSSLRDRFAQFLSAERKDLMRRLCRMSRARHARFHNTIYRLEPDVKEMPGGLRDLQTIQWLRTLRESAPPADEDPRPAEFLASVRCFLHFRAGRDQNILSFEDQDEIAAAVFSPWPDPAEWMRAWYRHASRIHQQALCELELAESQDRSLLASFRDWRTRLSNADFTVSRDLIFLRNPAGLEAEPEMALRLFLFVARHGVPLARQTEQRIVGYLLQWSGYFSLHPPKAAFWKDLLSLPHAPQALRAMRNTGFLSLIIPAWERIEHLVVRDFYHQYTVDEHTIVTLDVLAGLSGELSGAEARMAVLLSESANEAWLLRLALLLHDTGKGSGRDHSRESARLAGELLDRMDMPEQEKAMVLNLIGKHLLLSAAMQTRDLAHPATAAALAAEVKTVETLRLLTLMTYADISAVNSIAMTPWRLEQLLSVYRLVYRQLTGELSQPSGDDPHAVFGPLPPEARDFLKGLPARYLWTHTREQMLEQVELFKEAQSTGAALSLKRRNGAWLVTLVAEDHPFLFASVAGALSSFGLNILQAEAFTNANGFVADAFVVVDPNQSVDLNPSEQERLRSVVRKVALGSLRVEELLRSRPVKPVQGLARAIKPSVSFDNDASPTASVFEVIAQDRPGLLYHLSSAISRNDCNIEVVLVDTEAHRALDVFHVTSDGVKLGPGALREVRDALLSACA